MLSTVYFIVPDNLSLEGYLIYWKWGAAEHWNSYYSSSELKCVLNSLDQVDFWFGRFDVKDRTLGFDGS